MRRLIFTLIAITVTIGVFAQDTTSKAKKWKTGAWVSLVGAQSGSRNWAAGTEKFSLGAAANLILTANTTGKKSTWENSLELAYGIMNTHSTGVRKTDDKIDLYSIYSYGSKAKSGLGIAANVRTQIHNGYDYTETPARRTSGFFAPAYITFGAGYNLKPIKEANILLGAAARWVVVTNSPYSFNHQGGVKPDGSIERPLAEMYGVDPERQVRFEAGPYASARFNRSIMKNVHYRTRLDLNSDLIGGEPFNVDVYWTNMISMKVNKYLHVLYTFDLISDDDVRMFGDNKTSPATQLKSMLGVGLAAKF